MAHYWQLGIVNPNGTITPRRILCRHKPATTVTVPVWPKAQLWIGIDGTPVFIGNVEVKGLGPSPEEK